VNGAPAVIPIRAGVVDASADCADDGPAHQHGAVRMFPEAIAGAALTAAGRPARPEGAFKCEATAISGESGGWNGESCDQMRVVSLSEAMTMFGDETSGRPAIRAIAAGSGRAAHR
jgi:hypothetical protein